MSRMMANYVCTFTKVKLCRYWSRNIALCKCSISILHKSMEGKNWRQSEKRVPLRRARPEGALGIEGILPNPKLRLMDQVREVMRLKHYSIRTERCYSDWIRRYIHFHKMRARKDLSEAEPKIELFLSDLAVNGKVAASTQNQAFNGLLFLHTNVL